MVFPEPLQPEMMYILGSMVLLSWVCHSVAEQGEIALARVSGEDFRKGSGDFPHCRDVLLPPVGQTDCGRHVMDVHVEGDE